MYESYTDAARHVCQLANQNAQRFNNPEIKPEHYLRGFCQNGGGLAEAIFNKLGVSLYDMITFLDKKITPGDKIVEIGRVPLSEAARRVLELTESVAKALHVDYVGTEHILLALTHKEFEGTIVSQVLSQFGITSERLKVEILNTYSSQEAYV